MKLVHTMLFMLRQQHMEEDLQLAADCFKSLENSSYKTFVIYNQGVFKNDILKAFLTPFNIECHVIGDGLNVGTVVGRQRCFEYIWEHMPDTAFISELHMDMVFPPNWEDALVRYLEENDEPIVSCGIVDKDGQMPFLDKKVQLPKDRATLPGFLESLRENRIVPGFSNPCVHVSSILKQTGGYHAEFLKGRQCFEDDSMLLGYHYYYGTRHNWRPKINYHSVVYHAVAGQRKGVWDDIKVNFSGLVKQYGAMGLKALSEMHSSLWHKRYFNERYNEEVAGRGAAKSAGSLKVLLMGNKLFSLDMLWGFQQAGHEAIIINPTSSAEAETILGQMNAELLITMGAPLELNRDVLAYIGSRRPSQLKHMHWDTDGILSRYYPSESGDGIEMDVIYLSKPDLVFTICPEMCDFVKEKGFACMQMHYAFSPISHRPPEWLDDASGPISLIGNSYIARYKEFLGGYRYNAFRILLQKLLQDGCEVHFHSDTGFKPLIKMLFDIDVPPEYFHGYLPYEYTREAYGKSFVNLVVQNSDRTITKRTFEILACGGFALSADNTELRKLFVPGRDLVVSSSPEQTLELVRYYQSHIDEWKKIRENALQTIRDHSYKQRAEFIVGQYKALTAAK